MEDVSVFAFLFVVISWYNVISWYKNYIMVQLIINNCSSSSFIQGSLVIASALPEGDFVAKVVFFLRVPHSARKWVSPRCFIENRSIVHNITYKKNYITK